MSDPWESWADLTSYRRYDEEAGIKARARVVRNGGVTLTFTINASMAALIGEVSLVRVRAGDAPGCRMRLDLGHGDIQVRKMLPSSRGRARSYYQFSVRAPRWIPAQATASLPVIVESRDATGLVLHFDARVWGREEAPSVVRAPAVSQTVKMVTPHGLASIIRRSGAECEPGGDGSFLIDGRRVAGASAVGMANELRAKAGEDPVRVAA